MVKVRSIASLSRQGSFRGVDELGIFLERALDITSTCCMVYALSLCFLGAKGERAVAFLESRLYTIDTVSAGTVCIGAIGDTVCAIDTIGFVLPALTKLRRESAKHCAAIVSIESFKNTKKTRKRVGNERRHGKCFGPAGDSRCHPSGVLNPILKLTLASCIQSQWHWKKRM